MRNIVFILGAGASREAGGPLMKDFLDKAEDVGNAEAPAYADDFELVFRGHQELERVHATARLDTDNVEDVFAGFEMAQLLRRLGNLSAEQIEGLVPSLKRVIEVTISKTVPQYVRQINQVPTPTSPYKQFASLVKKLQQQVSIITFNYDLAVDAALPWRHLVADYCLEPSESASIPAAYRVPLLKLHGSLNWARSSSDDGRVVAWSISEYLSAVSFSFKEAGSEERFCEIVSESFDKMSVAVESEPVIVPPTWNKGSHHTEIARVWREAARRISEARHICIFGYSLPETDYFFKYLFGLGSLLPPNRLRTLRVFDPDDDRSVESRFQTLLGPTLAPRFQMHRVIFSHALEQLDREMWI